MPTREFRLINNPLVVVDTRKGPTLRPGNEVTLKGDLYVVSDVKICTNSWHIVYVQAVAHSALKG